MNKFFWIFICFLLPQFVCANPHWDEQRVPRDSQYLNTRMRTFDVSHLKAVKNDDGINVLRVLVNWEAANETYTVKLLTVEPSGTQALLERSKHKPKLGSYLGVLKDKTGREVYFDSIGTGKEYRALARAISLRFPVPSEDMTFELYAEHPKTGVMEKVVSQTISVNALPQPTPPNQQVKVRELSLASASPVLRVNIYAEGYRQEDEEDFWKHAMKTVHVLKNENFPGIDHMSFYGVFAPSNNRLGVAKKLGYPVPVYDTFLGLYYAYWANLQRWYNVIYPTDENKLRQGLASAPYDYPIILNNNAEYWGVGNYMVMTSIPAAHHSFSYLLLHEFGHYFGLNEEYNGGGPTELEFAPDMVEPWSQNITFLVDKTYQHLKWKKFVKEGTKLPTPALEWRTNPPNYGAYRGGYADSVSTKGKSHIPGLYCVMESRAHFCDVCKEAIAQVVAFSLGK